MRLVGKGILEPRAGTGHFHLSNSGQTVRYITDFYLNGVVELLTIGDDGYLTKKQGTSYARVMGASFASGARPEGVQIYGRHYLVDGVHPLSRYDGTTLLTYTKLSRPTSLTATKLSGTTGTFVQSWKVSAESDVGETLASDPVTLSNMPESWAGAGLVKITWTPSSPASSVRGYVIYGRESGGESYMTRVPAEVSQWLDDDSVDPSFLVYPSDSDTTDGPIAAHIRKHREKIVLANINGDNSQFLWGGSGPNIDKFHYSKGGGYYSIEKNSSDRWGITGLSEKEGKLIVFKGQSIYQVTFAYNNDLGINEAQVSKIVDGVGCIAAATIQEVENSIMFVAYVQGRGLALAKLDYEPNILSSVLRFQPISARVQSIIDSINFSRVQETWATYIDKKYHWFLPVGGNSWSCLVYDVERLAFIGPWTLTNAWAGAAHLDASNKYHFLIGKNDGNVVELSDIYADDEGTAFTWRLISRKDDFDRPFQLKTILDAKTKLRNISGNNVDISYIIEGQNGITSTAKTVTARPPTTLAGWGSRPWAGGKKNRWGYQPSTSNSNSNVVVKYSRLNKTNVLSAQVQIQATGAKAQIISSEIRAREQSRNLIPNSWKS